MPNRIEARSAKAALTNATGRLPLLRLFSTPLIDRVVNVASPASRRTPRPHPARGWVNFPAL
jgi:hypothetical protein